jgi:hypothetical protein
VNPVMTAVIVNVMANVIASVTINAVNRKAYFLLTFNNDRPSANMLDLREH